MDGGLGANAPQCGPLQQQQPPPDRNPELVNTVHIIKYKSKYIASKVLFNHYTVRYVTRYTFT